MPVLRITAPLDGCCPFDETAQSYWRSSGKTVTSFFSPMFDAVRPIVIAWEYEGEAAGFTVTYGRSDSTDSVTLRLPPSARFAEVYNLYKATAYTVRVTAEGNAPQTAERTFTTADFGPRVLHVPKVANLRDCGGYAAGDTFVKQGLVYRGSTLTSTADFPSVELTDEGRRVLLEDLGIRTEIDLRGEQEAKAPIPPLPIDRVFCTVNGYLEYLEQYREGYRRCFALLADERRYPIYFHCTGGADRTGTVAFLLGALLGVSEEELVKDYEFTSFSSYGIRDSRVGTYSSYFQMMKTALDACDGETLQQKTESLLLSIGVTPAEMTAIQENLLQ